MRRRSKKMECWNGMLEPGVQRCKCFKAARVHDLDLQNNMNYKPTVSIRITTYGLGGASILIDASSRQLVTGHNPRTTTATATYTALHTTHRHNTSTTTAKFTAPHTGRTHLLQATTSTHSTATRARAHTRTLPHAPQHTARARTHTRTLPHAQYASAEQLQRRCQQQQWRRHWSTDFNVYTST